MFLAVVMPLWSSILVRIFAWRTILGSQGLLNEFLTSTGHPRTSSSAFLYNESAVAITWAYVWLPFMILPIYTALEKIPESYLEASRDLGAGVLTTFRRVILPLALPGVVAGSIFVFSLTMGDFVAPPAGRRRLAGARRRDQGPLRRRGGLPVRRRAGVAHARDADRVPHDHPPHRRTGERVMGGSGAAEKLIFGTTAALVFVFLYLPLP